MKNILSSRLRSFAPGTYGWLVKLRASSTMHLIRWLPSIPLGEWLMWRNRPYLLVDISDKMGLGATLSLSVRILQHAQETGLRPVLRFSNPLYSPTGRSDTDWLPLLFDRRDCDGGAGPPAKQFLRRYWHVERHMRDAHGEISVRKSHDLFLGYMQVREDVTDSVDEFCRNERIGKGTLAIHYRGTDKFLESPRVELEKMLHSIEQHAGNYETIFVATDEPEFLAHMRDRFPAHKVRDLGCKWIFPDSQPAHLMPGNGLEKAREALITMLVLARCGLCIRTPSNLSHWARIFNPELPTILVQ